MRIHSFHSENTNEEAVFSATVSWEDCDRPDQQLFFKTNAAYADHLASEPQAFLVAALAPAMRLGEHRVALDGTVTPALMDNLHTVMSIWHTWYDGEMPLLTLEARPSSAPVRLPAEPIAGAFLSGGLDSLALLRHNRLTYPTEHPYSIKTGLIVHGFDIGAFATGDREQDIFDRALRALDPIVQDADVNLIPVYTNIRHLDDGVQSWMDYYHGAALSSVAHALSGQLSSMSIASADPIAALQPWGSHPLLDPCFSSERLQIRHENLRFSRLEKTRLVADWPAGLANLRVCTKNHGDLLNCGQCEKCLRTMLHLLAAGKLNQTSAFPYKDVTAVQLAGICISLEVFYHYAELLDPLDAIGRRDLTAVLREKLEEQRKYIVWQQERDWKGLVKRFDRKLLGGDMVRSYATLRRLVFHGH